MGVKLATVNEIAAKADFITVHTPLTKETRHLIARPQFELMKKGRTHHQLRARRHY